MKNIKKAYLFERKYEVVVKKEIKEKKEYWRKLLGDSVLNKLSKSNNNFLKYLQEIPYEVKDLKDERIVEDCQSYLLDNPLESKKRILDENKIFFVEFYKGILIESTIMLNSLLYDKTKFWDEQILSDFAFHLITQLNSICLRTLILKMNEYKNRGGLKGSSPEEEYIFFCDNIICTTQFYEEVMDQYPVLHRCIQEKTKCLIEFYIEIIENFSNDLVAINNNLSCGEKKAQKIISIEGNISDVHNNGRQVVIVKLDTDVKILYKPHSMDNEKIYKKLLVFISDKTGTKQMKYPILSYYDHSWCSFVKMNTCKELLQLGNYYVRLGEQLFLAYLLGTKDLHRENIIACGEYPVLIDLENLVNIHYNHERKNATEEVYYQLLQSVLFTGLLPFYLWNEMGEGICDSALGANLNQKYPFKMAGIANPKTSNMKIEYYHPIVKKTKNSATINEEYYPPYLFQDELIRGFRQAYKCVMKYYLEVYNLIKDMGEMTSRYLLADTQRYSMLLSSSYHPALLVDAADREIFLYSIWKGRKEYDKQFVDYEVRAMIKGDIPYFYYRLNDTTLYSKNGMEIKQYFKQTPIELVLQKLISLNNNDKEIQCEYIRLSLSISPENKDVCMNRVYFKEKADKYVVSINEKKKEYEYTLMEKIQELVNRLKKYAVWNSTHTEVNWYIMQLASVNSMTWNIKSMNYYLYNGLAGMLILFENINIIQEDEEVMDIKDTLKRMLFSYTEQGIKSIDYLCSLRSGAFDGESSILYTYVLLYKVTKDERYLEYANKHVLIVEKLIEQDVKFDLIAGNAGAILAILKLYELDPKEKYCEILRHALDVLEKNTLKMNKGIGWICEKDIPVMGGMAHGNAGILLAIVKAWKVIKEERLLKLALMAIEYEETLYEERINNWKDMRNEVATDDIIDSVAWCHGAAGILLSRVQVYKCLEKERERLIKTNFEQLIKKVERDIQRSYKKLREYPYRDSWCLCHGTLGNIWILEEVDEICELLDFDYISDDSIVKIENVFLLPQERLNPGLMNGYGGVLYYLLKLYKRDIPNILSLE